MAWIQAKLSGAGERDIEGPNVSKGIRGQVSRMSTFGAQAKDPGRWASRMSTAYLHVKAAGARQEGRALHGPWDSRVDVNAPLYDQDGSVANRSVDSCVLQYAHEGAPQDRFNLGLAFYGHSFWGGKQIGDACKADWSGACGDVQTLRMVNDICKQGKMQSEPWFKNG